MAETKPKATVVPGFLRKTFEIFSNPEYQRICGWNDAGDAISIRQPNEFTTKLLPKYFKHQNLPSFIRQLNMYGFRKTMVDAAIREFQHEYFRRNQPDLLHLIKRKRSMHEHIEKIKEDKDTSDRLLSEIREIHLKNEAMEKRLERLETENTLSRMSNERLWEQLRNSKERQTLMQQKLQKIVMFIYQIYRGTKGSNALGATSSTGTSSSTEITPFTESSSTVFTPKEFSETLKMLCMDDPSLLEGITSSEETKHTPTESYPTIVEVPNEEPATAPGSASKKRKFEDTAGTPRFEQLNPDEVPPGPSDLLSDDELQALSKDQATLGEEQDSVLQKIGELHEDIFTHYNDIDQILETLNDA